MTDFPNCSKINLWQERKAAAAAGWEGSGSPKGDTCLSGVPVMSDAQCEDSQVTLRVSVNPYDVYLSTKTVKETVFISDGSCWTNQPLNKNDKTHKSHYQVLIEPEMKAQER